MDRKILDYKMPHSDIVIDDKNVFQRFTSQSRILASHLQLNRIYTRKGCIR
ncbi:hypothetical protein AGR1B_pTi0197 [Agrobacterium fabacearum S56]|uniref:Uncharacterized protein n=1 Tax=Agrobacterium deltaense Zutra 3/1 TaxID=1183427 RepID=A0A1S7S588_9HYPH|nr:hypothetical protein AGR1B_pTi0197 [Agrobacterium fabacearum S56]CUX62779.1 hypothetical protein AGR7C_pTi0031 [Agrobacterium deltaense Zutra 3/1]